MIHFPPLFPVLTAVVTFVCHDLGLAARILNLVLFAANTCLMCCLVALQRPSGWIRPALAGVLFAGSVDIMQIHSMAWSEPTFLFLLLAGSGLLVRHIQSPNRALLAGCIGFLSLAPLARYVGITVIPAACLVLLLYRGLREALVFGILTVIPLLLWLLRNLSVGGRPTTGNLLFHYYSFADLNQTLYFISTWLVPHSVPGLVKQAVLAVFVLCFAALIISLRRKRPLPLSAMLLSFLAIYSAFLVFVRTLVYSNLALDSRMLTPLLACTILLLVLETPGRPAFAVMAILVAGSFVVRAGMWINTARMEGLGYTGPQWSLAQKQIESARLTDPVFANLSQPVFRLLFGRSSLNVPVKYDLQTMIPNPAFEKQLHEMQESNGCLVLFFSEDYNDAMPRELELKRLMKLEQIHRDAEMVVFRIVSSGTHGAPVHPIPPADPAPE